MYEKVSLQTEPSFRGFNEHNEVFRAILTLTVKALLSSGGLFVFVVLEGDLIERRGLFLTQNKILHKWSFAFPLRCFH